MVAKTSCNRSASSSVSRDRNLSFRSRPTQPSAERPLLSLAERKQIGGSPPIANGLVLRSRSRMGQDVIIQDNCGGAGWKTSLRTSGWENNLVHIAAPLASRTAVKTAPRT